MCGIIGQIGQQSENKDQKQALLALQHRGPDGGREWVSSSGLAWLGHRRLSIVDLSDAGTQPMHNEDDSIWLVCNGEIYNYYELRKRLEGLGHDFYSNSDSECIVHAYEQWGEQCVENLVGMFAFAIWDENLRKIFIARDRVGIKPLYYSVTNRGLVFSSELRALYPLLNTEKNINPLAIAYLIFMSYIPAPYSIISGVYKLEAGHTISWDFENAPNICNYWEPPRYIDNAKTYGFIEWRELFENVLNDHLLSDVPIGLFLSAGLDSTSIALGLNRLGYQANAITVSFPQNAKDNEAPLAKKIANHLGIKHAVISAQSKDLFLLRKKVAHIYDEPFGASAALTMSIICEATTQKGYKVVFGGDGGDEVFSGYKWYRKLVEDSFKKQLSNHFNNVKARLINDKRTIFFQRSPLHRHISRITHSKLLPSEIEKILAPMNVRFREDEMLAPFDKHFVKTLPIRRALQRVDLMTFCTDEVLFKVDRASMAYGLEVRVPYLDHRIIEYGLNLPEFFDDQIVGKQPIRQYLRGNVPEELFSHPKQGFSFRAFDNFNWENALNEIDEGFWVKEKLISDKWKEYICEDNSVTLIWEMLSLTDWAEIWQK